MKRDYYFLFAYTFNGQSRTIKIEAENKLQAIDLAFEKVCKYLNIKRCELTNWDCYIVRCI